MPAIKCDEVHEKMSTSTFPYFALSEKNGEEEFTNSKKKKNISNMIPRGGSD